jgi:hypothetical protein
MSHGELRAKPQRAVIGTTKHRSDQPGTEHPGLPVRSQTWVSGFLAAGLQEDLYAERTVARLTRNALR